jgi:hypothetical protein
MKFVLNIIITCFLQSSIYYSSKLSLKLLDYKSKFERVRQINKNKYKQSYIKYTSINILYMYYLV